METLCKTLQISYFKSNFVSQKSVQSKMIFVLHFGSVSFVNFCPILFGHYYNNFDKTYENKLKYNCKKIKIEK